MQKFKYYYFLIYILEDKIFIFYFFLLKKREMVRVLEYKINEKYLKMVSDYQPELLPRPKRKIPDGFLVLVDTGEGNHEF
jgi:hypothetical protein